MKIADTISVNPSKTALGHVETPATPVFRSPVLGVETPGNSINLVKVIFPTTKSGLHEFSKYDVPLRTLFSTILIVTGIYILTAPVVTYSIGFAVCSLVFGGLLAMGLLTRPVMLGAAVYYCISGALALRSGTPDISVFSLMFGSLIFGVIGSGKYSLDSIIRHSIQRTKRNSERKRKGKVLGYKAFHQVKY